MRLKQARKKMITVLTSEPSLIEHGTRPTALSLGVRGCSWFHCAPVRVGPTMSFVTTRAKSVRVVRIERAENRLDAELVDLPTA